MLPVSRPSLPPLVEYVAKLEKIWSTRMLTNFASFAVELESIAQSYLGNPFTRAVVSCDVGLMASIAALQIAEGTECIVPSFTFNSTLNAVLWNRLLPRFADIDRATCNVDPQDVERRITSRTGLIVATHVFGSPCDVARLKELADANRIPLVFDAAHAYGASFRGQRIGSSGLGDFQVFSLSGTKQVTSAEGGLVAACEEELAERVELIRAYGFKYDYVSRVTGINGKMSELHAALGTLTLPRVDEAVERRNLIADRYRQLLGGLEAIGFQEHLPGCHSSYKDFAIVCRHGRDELARHLAERGIQTKKYFLPLHNMPAYRQFCSTGDDLHDTEETSARVLCLPMFQDLSDGDQQAVGEMVNEFYRRRR